MKEVRNVELNLFVRGFSDIKLKLGEGPNFGWCSVLTSGAISVVSHSLNNRIAWSLEVTLCLVLFLVEGVYVSPSHLVGVVCGIREEPCCLIENAVETGRVSGRVDVPPDIHIDSDNTIAWELNVIPSEV